METTAVRAWCEACGGRAVSKGRREAKVRFPPHFRPPCTTALESAKNPPTTQPHRPLDQALHPSVLPEKRKPPTHPTRPPGPPLPPCVFTVGLVDPWRGWPNASCPEFSTAMAVGNFLWPQW